MFFVHEIFDKPIGTSSSRFHHASYVLSASLRLVCDVLFFFSTKILAYVSRLHSYAPLLFLAIVFNYVAFKYCEVMAFHKQDCRVNLTSKNIFESISGQRKKLLTHAFGNTLPADCLAVPA